MSDPIMWRGIERILIVLISLIFGYLGYKLYIHGIDKGKGKLNFKSKFFEIIFSGRGPGLFFMAFAAIIMAFAIFKGGASESTKKILPQVEKAASKKAQPELTISTNKKKQRRKKESQSETVIVTTRILEKIEPIKVSPDRNIKNLRQALNDEDSGVRWKAAKALAEIKSEKAVESLIQALKDEDSDVREAAAEALGKIKSLKAVEPLILALKDEESEVRREAADALGQIKSKKAVEPLIQALLDNDENYAVHWAVAEALGEIKSRKAVEPLILALKDEEYAVRCSAAEALAKIKPELEKY